jgi:hypothetical protein
MSRKLFFLSVAGGLLANLAFAAPSHAGPEYLATTYSEIVLPSGANATDIEITYSGPITTPVTILGTTTVSVVGSPVISGDTITISFTKASGVNGAELDFTTMTTSPSLNISSDSLTGVTGLSGTNKGGVLATVVVSSVPEPTSMALLGIGMTGFLAFRRLFKRTSAA